MDARRWANRRGGFPIRGPRKIYDTTPALVGALWTQQRGVFRPYTEETFARFFRHELELDLPEQVAALIDELDGSGTDYQAWLAGQGAAALERCIAEAHEDHIFGVPIFNFRGELFWGHDRIPLLEERLREHGLER
jgi:2-hydroxychromene-2-carboxylate isomerase